MESLKNCDSFHQTVDIPHYVERSLDPINPLFCYNPIAANPNNATFSQEPYLCCNPIAANPNNATFSQEPYLYPHDRPEQKIWKDAWIHESVGILAKEAKPTEAMACKSLAPQSFPRPEEQPFGKGEITDAESSKRRKIRKPEKGPIYIFKTRSENNVVEDGYKWRKYGTKILKGSPNPRGYYRCSESNCSVKKKVERDPSDPGLLLTTYEGTHNHESHCVIYYIWEPIMLPEPPGSKPAIVSVNAGVCSEI